MTDEARLDIDSVPMVTSVGKATRALDQLMRAMETLASKAESTSYRTLVDFSKNAEELKRSVKTQAQIIVEAAATMQGELERGVANTNRKQLNLVAQQNKDLQQRYEEYATQQLAQNKGLTAETLRVWAAAGANLSKEQKKWLKDQTSQELAAAKDRIANLETARSLEVQLEKLKYAKLQDIVRDNLRLKKEEALASQTIAKENSAFLRFQAEADDAFKRQSISKAAAFAKQQVTEALASSGSYTKYDGATGAVGAVQGGGKVTQLAAEYSLVEKYLQKTEARELASQVLRDDLVRKSADRKLKDLEQAKAFQDKIYLQEVTALVVAQDKKLALQKAYQLDVLRDVARFEAEKAAMIKTSAASFISGPFAGQRMDSTDIIKYQAEMLKLVPVTQTAAVAAKELDQSHLRFNGTLKEGNAAMRGFTQGLGFVSAGMYSILPFMASFLAGAAVMKTLKIGSQFETSLFVIKELAGNSREAMEALEQSVLKLADASQYGPLELAKALETLTLAGLSAESAMKALQPTLQFASATNMPIEAAAETLVAVQTAYKYTVESFSTIGDLIAKTAADTMASGQSMSEAFRTASVVAQQYKVTLEDTAVALGVLAQIGIKGGAAGTSFRNMVTELNKGSGKAADGIKELGVQVQNLSGTMRPIMDVMRDLSSGLITRTGAAQQRLLQDMTNERGAKAVAAFQSEMLATLNKTNPKLQEQANEFFKLGEIAKGNALLVGAVEAAYAKMKSKVEEGIDEAAAFTFFANLEKRLTEAAQYKGITASIEKDFVEAFGKSSDAVYVLGEQLRNVFKSEEFRSTLNSIVAGMVKLAEVMVVSFDWALRNKEAMAALGVAALGLAVGLSPVVAGVTALVVAFSGLSTWSLVALGSIAAVTSAFLAWSALPAIIAAVEVGVLAVSAALAISPLGAVAVAVGVLSAAYIALRGSLKAYTDQKNLGDAEASGNSKKSVEESLQAEFTKTKASFEANKLKIQDTNTTIAAQLAANEETIAAAKRGDSAQETSVKVAGAAHLARVKQMYQELYLMYEMNRQIELGNRLRADNKLDILTADAASRATMEKLLSVEYGREAVDVAKSMADTERLVAQTKTLAAISKANAATANQVLYGVSNEGGFTGKGKKGGRAGPTSGPLKFTDDDMVSALDKRYASEISVIKDSESRKKTLLDAQHSNKLISDWEFYAKDLQAAQDAEDRKLADINKYGQETAAAYKANYSKQEAEFKAFLAKGNHSQKELEDGLVAYQVHNNKLVTERQTQQAKTADELAKFAIERAQRMALATTALEGKIKATQESSKQFLRSELELGATKAIQIQREDQLRGASEETKAALSAQYAEYDRLSTIVKSYSKDIEATTLFLGIYEAEIAAGIKLTEAEEKAYIAAKTSLDALNKAKGLVTSTIPGAVAKSEADARLKLGKDSQQKLVEDISGAIEAGLVSGAEAGKTKLRDILQAELLKPIRMAIQAFVSPVLNGISGGISSALGLGGEAAGGGSLLSGVSSAAGLAGAFGAFGTGVSSGLTAWGAGGSVTGLLGTGSAIFSGGIASGLGTLAGALGPIAIGIALLAHVFGDKGFKSTSSTGDSLLDSDARGITTSLTAAQAGHALSGRTELSDNVVTGMRDAYVSFTKALGITTAATQFTYGGNTGAQGENPNFALGGGVYGKGGFYQPETRTSKEAVKLAAARAVFASLQQSELPSYLAGIFDDLTVGTMTQQQIDSTLALAQSFKTLHDQLLALPFENLKNLSYAAASGLVKAAGSMEALTASLSTYYDKFYTTEQKTALATGALASSLTQLGLSMPELNAGARDVFKGWVESQDATTESGQKTIASLLALAGSFDEVVSATEAAVKANLEARESLLATRKIWENKLNVLNGTTTERDISLAEDLNGVTDEYARSLIQQVYALESAKLAAEEASAASEAYANASRAVIEAWQGITDSIIDEINRIRGVITGTGSQGLAQAQSAFTVATAQARAGDKVAAASLPELSRNLLSLAESNAGTLTELRVTQAQVAASLEATKAAIGQIAGTQAGAAYSSFATVGNSYPVASAPAPASSEFVIGGGARPLVGGALAQVAVVAAQAAIASQVLSAASSTGDFVIGGRSPSPASSVAAEASPSLSYSPPRFASRNLQDLWLESLGDNVHKFDVGTNYVPRDMLAFVHEGEEITPRAYNPAAGGTRGGDGEAAAETRELRLQMSALIQTNKQLAIDMETMRKVLVNVTENGKAMKTEAFV